MGECSYTDDCPDCGEKLFKVVQFPELYRCYGCAQYWSDYGIGKLTKETDCPHCGTTMTEGLFRVACKKCNPFQFESCGLCGTKRLWCCC